MRGGTADVNDDDDSSVHPAVDLNKLSVLSIIDSNSRIVRYTPSAEVTITFTPPKVDMHGIGFMNKDYLDTMVVSSRLSSATTTLYSLVVRENGMALASPMRRMLMMSLMTCFIMERHYNHHYDGEALQALLSFDVKASSSYHDISSSSSSSSIKLLQYRGMAKKYLKVSLMKG